MGFGLKEILPPSIEELISVIEFSTESLSDDALDSVEDCRSYFQAIGCLHRDRNGCAIIDTLSALEKISDFYNTQRYDDILSELLDTLGEACVGRAVYAYS